MSPLLLALVVAASAPAQEAAVPAPAASSANSSQTASSRAEKLDTKGIIRDSLSLLAIEHVGRIVFQEKTRRELSGPFWHDYVSSVRMPKTWSDGDGSLVNYIGHPIHGAAAGFVFLKHDPRSGKEQFGLSAGYWKTRWRPTVFAALYSVQFEVGPLSEASIGNVGMHPNTTGWVDYVVTPLGAMAFLVAEDAADRYVVRWAEEHVSNKVLRGSLRIFFGPSQALANMAMGHMPWHRESRPLGWRH
jgi:hypothetical protein